MILLHFPLWDTAIIALISCIVSTLLIFGGRRIYHWIKYQTEEQKQKQFKDNL